MNKAAIWTGMILPLMLLSACSSGPYDLEGARIGGEFSLVDQNGKTVKWTDFQGKYRLVYFGYANCPDVCPLDLGEIMAGYRLLQESDPAKAAKIQPIFITVDPARDTPAAMKTYVEAFPPNLIGLTGSTEEIEGTKKAFVVVGGKEGDPKATKNYLVNHSRTPFFFDPAGKPIALVPINDGATDAAEYSREGVRDFLKKWVK